MNMNIKAFFLSFLGILPNIAFSAEPFKAQDTIDVYPQCLQGTPTLIRFVPMNSETAHTRYSVFFITPENENLQPLKFMTHNIKTGEVTKTESRIFLDHFPTVQDLVDTFSMITGMPKEIFVNVIEGSKEVAFSLPLAHKSFYGFHVNFGRVTGTSSDSAQ